MPRPRLATIVIAGIFVVATTAAAADWTRFRGPNGTGVASGTTIPVQFKEGDGILWKLPLRGVGNSSPVISRGRLFLQSAGADGNDRFLICLDATTGRTLWTRTTPGSKAPTHAANTLASATPAVDGERVYNLSWNGKTVALEAVDYEGKPLWSQDLGPFRSQHGNGTSPVVYDGRVFVNFDQDRLDYKTHAEIPDQEHATAVLAFDAATGKPLWRRERKGQYACYSVPMIRDTARGGRELIVMNTHALTAYDPATGSTNWNFDWTWQDGEEVLRTVASPVMWNDLIYLHGGNGAGTCRITAVRAGEPGKPPEAVWEKRKGFAYVPCMLVAGDYLFTVYDKAPCIAGCFEAATGNTVWTQSLSGSFKSSPVLIDGKVYLISEDGIVLVYAATPKYQLLARNPLGETVRSSPAVADGRLYIRGEKHLFCIGKKE